MAVEPPLRVEHREELIWLLTQACEPEHGLMCEYLFAPFTLKRTQQEGLSVEQLAKVASVVVEWPELTAVTDLASAKAAIELIVEQGEGARGHWRDAHFGKFVALLEDYLATRTADPGFDPARPVEPAYVRPPDVEAETLTITDPLTAQVADLFNAIYETTLQTLSRYFVHSGETDGQVRTLATTAKHLMNWVMRPLGSLLTTRPVGPDRPGALAGPAFEIVQPSFYVLPHRVAAWRILAERLEQLAARADRLSRNAGLAQLAELATDLHGMARDIEAA